MPSTVPTKSMTTISPFSAARSTGSALALPLGDALQRLVDLVVGHLGLQPLELELGEIHRLDLGQHLDRQLVFEVGAFVEDDDLDLGLQRRAQIALAHRLGRAVVDRVLQHLAHDRGAVALAQHGQRHLAGAEARQADRAADFARGDRSTRRSISAAATTTLNSCFSPSALVSVTCMVRSILGSACRLGWCGRRDLNPHDLRRWNLNPVRLPIPPRPRCNAGAAQRYGTGRPTDRRRR